MLAIRSTNESLNNERWITIRTYGRVHPSGEYGSSSGFIDGLMPPPRDSRIRKIIRISHKVYQVHFSFRISRTCCISSTHILNQEIADSSLCHDICMYIPFLRYFVSRFHAFSFSNTNCVYLIEYICMCVCVRVRALARVCRKYKEKRCMCRNVKF